MVILFNSLVIPSIVLFRLYSALTFHHFAETLFPQTGKEFFHLYEDGILGL